jgi:F-type H+-transporting ATPase subunit b
MAIFHQAEFWVAVAFLMLIALFFYLQVPAKIIAALDERAAAIAKTLAEAEKLRQDAETLLKDYQHQHIAAAAEAERIVAQARRDAETYAAETRAKLNELIERRSASAQQKIAQAEAQALKDVRATAAERAIAMASHILKQELKGPAGARLIDRSIADLKIRAGAT